MARGVVDELREQLETAESLSHTGSWRWDFASNTITWSDEMYRICGLEPQSQAITVERFEGFMLPENRHRVRDHIELAMRTPGRYEYRDRILRPSGELRTITTVITSVTDATGAVVQLIGACRDLTEDAHRDAKLHFHGDVFANLDIGLTAWERDARDGAQRVRLVAYNAAAERLAGRSLAPHVGHTLVSIFPHLEASELVDAARARDGVRARTRHEPLRLVPAPAPSPIVAATLFPLPNDHIGVSFEDVTQQHHALVIQAGERRALEMLASGTPLTTILDLLVGTLEDVFEGAIGSILLLDNDGVHVAHGAAPHLPRDYARAIDGGEIGPAAGSCGTAAYRGTPVYVADIASDPLWASYRDLALRHGLRACWSSPILSNERSVLGTFTLYFREPRAADQRAREQLERASHVAGIVLERRALDDRMRALAARIEQTREQERAAIARDVHDQLGQALTALKLDVGWLSRRITDSALVDRLADMASSLDDTIRSVRRISTELRPGVLDDLGLQAAIEWQIEEFQVRTDICSVAHAAIGDLQLDGELATTIFRIFQEALTNVARHADASEVQVSLVLDHGNIRLDVADDGVGIPEVGRRSDTLGLLGMRERARSLGGECTVSRRTPRGTLVRLTVPLKFPAERPAM
jgi:signal transduction histidine kinase|nr:GAF domain-containing protein [Kofleriaceae bacterium]